MSHTPRRAVTLAWLALASVVACATPVTALTPFDPGSVVLVRFDGGDVRVVAHGELAESCGGRGRLAAQVAATPDGFVLAPFQDQDDEHTAYVARLGRGCASETVATFENRKFAGLALDPSGQVWAADLIDAELVRLDLARAHIAESLPIPRDYRLLDIDGNGTFYLGALGQNVLPVSRNGELLPRFPTPAVSLAVAPDGNVWVSAAGGLTEFSPDGVALRAIETRPLTPPFVFEAREVLWILATEEQPEPPFLLSFLLNRMSTNSELLQTIRFPRDDIDGPVLLAFVPPAPKGPERQAALRNEGGCNAGGRWCPPGLPAGLVILLALALRLRNRRRPTGDVTGRSETAPVPPTGQCLPSSPAKHVKLPCHVMLFALLLTTLVASTSGAGSTYYVNCVSGNNGNPGTAVQPWQTIARAVNPLEAVHAMGGDAVVVQQGPCTEKNVTFGNTLSTSGACVTNPGECRIRSSAENFGGGKAGNG